MDPIAQLQPQCRAENKSFEIGKKIKKRQKHLNLSKSFFFSEVPVPDRRDRDLLGKSRRNSPRKSPWKSPPRPCMFCGQMQAHLKRHVTRKHRSHEEVRAFMKLPKAEQARAFDGITRRIYPGIWKC